MVECEYGLLSAGATDDDCFNRYMVECEFRSIIITLNTRLVLIDTWWNVNLIAYSGESKSMSFNRYMVECEFNSLF